MNHPKTEHKARKPAVPTHPRHEPAPAAARQTHASAGLIEACDRLGEKLDECAGVIREQIEAWRQIHPLDAPQPVPREKPGRRAVEPPAVERAPAAGEPPPARPPAAKEEVQNSQEEHSTVPPSAPPLNAPLPPAPIPAAAAQAPPPFPSSARPEETSTQDGLAAGVSRLFDMLPRDGGGWQEQASGMERALEAIMAYLENQAATIPPKIDVDGIMSRLRDLEERQQNLQSQVNNNRWGPG